MIGGNWFEGSRAIFGGEGTRKSSWTNQVIRFSLPADLQQTELDYRLTLRTVTQPHPVSIFFNDVKLAEGVQAHGGLSCEVPAHLFRAVNEVNVVNVSEYATNSYLGIDFLRLSVQKPHTGTFLILR